MRNDFLQRSHGHEPELQTQAAALRDPRFLAAALGDCDTAMVLLARVVSQAESQICHVYAGLAL
ncbi:MAG: hypothetical protein HIU89_11325 [Proteobacteria bacterium]|nr:hypothetical protein [Pseudomonadota bacterium]